MMAGGKSSLEEPKRPPSCSVDMCRQYMHSQPRTDFAAWRRCLHAPDRMKGDDSTQLQPLAPGSRDVSCFLAQECV